MKIGQVDRTIPFRRIEMRFIRDVFMRTDGSGNILFENINGYPAREHIGVLCHEDIKNMVDLIENPH